MNITAALTEILANHARVHAELKTNLTPNGIITCGLDGLVACYLTPRFQQILVLLKDEGRVITEYDILEQWVKDAGSRVRSNSGRLPNDPNERLAAQVRKVANERELTIAHSLLAEYTRWLNAQPAATA